MTNIKQHTLQSGERILLVHVPSINLHFDILNEFSLPPMIMGVDKQDLKSKCNRFKRGDQKGFYRLPQGNWQLIGLSDEITEEQAKEFVLTRVDQSSFPTSMEYYNYLSDRMVHLSFDFDTALESFKSLMQSLGCEGRYAVLREVKK